MSAIVATKTALQAIPVDRLRLIFVQENLSWYHGSPTSTAQTDGENVLAPNAGPGRYLKQFSVNPQNSVIWQTVSSAGNFTATPNTGYVFDFSGIAGDVTVTLPSNPAIGAMVKLLYGSQTNIQRRLLFTAGANLINGTAGTYFAFTRNQEITLTWMGTTLGWLYVSNLGLALQPAGSIINFAAPASTNIAQDGIFNWLGRRGNLANAYVNPAAAMLSNGFFLSLFNAHGYTGTLSSVVGRDTTAATALQTWNSASPGELLTILPMNMSNYSLQYPITLASIYFQGTNFTATNIAQIVVQGSNSFSEGNSDLWLRPSFINSPPLSTRADRDLNGVGDSAAWDTLATIAVSSLTAGTGFYGAAANSAFLLPVNSSRPYTAHRILLRHLGNAAQTIVVTELEFYGGLHAL